jgi:hypothetical protein
MCLIIASFQGTLPSKELLERAWEDNNHGWGIMWAENGTVRNVKGFRLDSLMRNVNNREGSPFVVHLRWATHGLVNTQNCHPFKVTKGLQLMHNGVMLQPETDKDMSDSWHFAQELRDLCVKYPGLDTSDNEDSLVAFTEKVCGTSKIAFMYSDGTIAIANEKMGSEYEGLWLSNEYSIPRNDEDLYAQFFGKHQERSKTQCIRPEGFFADGEIVEIENYDCDYCQQPDDKLFGYEGMLVCASCLDWAVREDLICKQMVTADQFDDVPFWVS